MDTNFRRILRSLRCVTIVHEEGFTDFGPLHSWLASSPDPPKVFVNPTPHPSLCPSSIFEAGGYIRNTPEVIPSMTPPEFITCIEADSPLMMLNPVKHLEPNVKSQIRRIVISYPYVSWP
jgi:hypothetical protein